MSPAEIAQRAAVVAEARSWLKTPYHHAADVKGSGIDCGMLMVRVFVDTGLCAPFDPRPYAADWMLHKSEEKYLGFVFDHAKEVLNPMPGDVAVFRFGRCYSHGGIVTRTKPITILHAYKPAGCVIEEEMYITPMLAGRRRSPKFYSTWAR